MELDSMFMDRIIKTVWFLICLIGIIVQNTYVTIDYFEYPTTSQVLFETEEKFVPPAFSLCFLIRHVRDKSSFDEGHLCHRGNLTHEEVSLCHRLMLFKHPIHETFFNKTLDLLNLIFGTDESETWINMNISRDFLKAYYDQFLMDQLKCIRFHGNPDHGSVLSTDTMTRLSTYKIYSGFGLKIQSELVTNEFLAMYTSHTAGSYPRGIWIKLKEVDHKSALIIVSFTKHQTEYLPAPYFSKCRNYFPDQIESPDHCLQICMQAMIAKFIHPDATAPQFSLNEDDIKKNRNLFYSELLAPSGTKGNNTLVEFKWNCLAKCPNNCSTKVYDTIQVAQYLNMMKNDSGYLKYQFGFENKYPATHVKFSPKTSLLEYMIYVASVCGLWIGISLFDLFIASSNQIKQFIIQKMSNRNRIFIKITPIHQQLNLNIVPNVINDQTAS